MTLKPVADGGRPVGRVYEGIAPAKSTKGDMNIRRLRSAKLPLSGTRETSAP
jgi:hypothetical protein